MLLLWAAAGLFGEVSFSQLHLSEGNDLLFQAVSDVPGQDQYRTLFLANLENRSIRQLSFFPEEIQYLSQTGQLQIQNRFGVFRTDKDLKTTAPISRFPSFAEGGQIQAGKIYPIQASPDGRFLLYLLPTDFAYADLVLLDLLSGKTETVSKRVELALSGPAAEWSPNSQFFIYSKTGRLFYYSLDQFLSGRIIDESFRSIGDGSMTSVRWGVNSDLYYISGTLVYQIMGIELFTRTLYQNLIRIGRIVGKIPSKFDPNFDRFWISPDGGKMLLDVGGRNIFVYYLQADDFLSTGKILSLPYLFLPRNTQVKTLIWSRSDVLTLLTEGISGGKKVGTVFRIDLLSGATAFSKTDDTGIRRIVLSPDESKAILLTEDRVVLHDYKSWREEKSYPVEAPLHAVWIRDSEIVVGGRYHVQGLDVNSGAFRFICYSQPEDYGFKDGKVLIQTKGIIKSFDFKSSQWEQVEEFAPLPAEISSPDYRVYTEALPSGSYRNLVMVRKTRKVGTAPLFTAPKETYDTFPDREETVNFSYFEHGSRIRGREISLVFNAIDSVEGLAAILQTLDEYKIKATFFINGDFIRRNPGAVKEIADSGHEVGSLFYTYFNMTDPQFKINADFIKQGLARNEDDYFSVTGKELTLLWHAPYYFVRSDIVKAAQDMNYTYVGRDVDSLDWVVKRDDFGINKTYFPSADLIERIMKQKQPGSIISMRIGKPGDSQIGSWREDYLFQKLDLLINLLFARGYRFLPVSGLIDRAR